MITEPLSHQELDRIMRSGADNAVIAPISDAIRVIELVVPTVA